MAEIQVGIQANAWLREFPIAENLDTVLQQIAESGYSGVEIGYHFLAGGRFNALRPGGAPTAGDSETTTMPDPAEVGALIAEHGLTLAALHTGGVFYADDVASEQTLPNLQIIATFAQAIGCGTVLISPAAKKDESKTDEELATQNTYLQQACALFNDHGAHCFHHTHGPELEDEFREMRRILELDPGYISLAYDIANAARVIGTADAVSFIDSFRSRIGYVHYKDCRPDGVLVEAIGDGAIDWHAVAGSLRSSDYSGWVVVEIEPGHGMEAHRSVKEDAVLSRQCIRETLGV
ncbi:MAG: sugar phosphate isomerase/epimerase [Chloroflexi bacterium]|nr:sugar phosphate isomerase/epimerase [Chloroflexota bacterium]